MDDLGAAVFHSSPTLNDLTCSRPGHIRGVVISLPYYNHGCEPESLPTCWGRGMLVSQLCGACVMTTLRLGVINLAGPCAAVEHYSRYRSASYELQSAEEGG